MDENLLPSLTIMVEIATIGVILSRRIDPKITILSHFERFQRDFKPLLSYECHIVTGTDMCSSSGVNRLAFLNH